MPLMVLPPLLLVAVLPLLPLQNRPGCFHMEGSDHTVPDTEGAASRHRKVNKPDWEGAGNVGAGDSHHPCAQRAGSRAGARHMLPQAHPLVAIVGLGAVAATATAAATAPGGTLGGGRGTASAGPRPRQNGHIVSLKKNTGPSEGQRRVAVCGYARRTSRAGAPGRWRRRHARGWVAA